jgi:pentose-5-phosphate-3-epimerase
MQRESGFGGQSFIENTYAKVKIKELITIKGVYDYRSGGVTNKMQNS